MRTKPATVGDVMTTTWRLDDRVLSVATNARI